MIHKFFGRLATARSFVFAMVSFAALALSAFDTPYLTFRSATSFTLSATKAWDGTLQKATSNPADGSSWSDWTGASITAEQTDGQYYIYLRGTGNTVVNNSYTAWTLTGSNIYCEGDIETLRGYNQRRNQRRDRPRGMPTEKTLKRAVSAGYGRLRARWTLNGA